jgi:hypothetical protein
MNLIGGWIEMAYKARDFKRFKRENKLFKRGAKK